MPDSTTLLQQILEITREMRTAALESDWELVQQSEAQRSFLIARCFPLQEAPVDPELTAASIDEIIELDRSIQSLALLARDEITHSLGKLKRGRQAINAYVNVKGVR
ncbi:MAG: flagellar protein FliT [Gammaproteobacteria bacterium]|nr:flagellar protein FliT [Gammaproteobacteria bacterium]